MVSVHREAGFRVAIYSDDHTPAHVHVYKGEGLAIIELPPIRLREFRGRYKEPDIARAVRLVERTQN